MGTADASTPGILTRRLRLGAGFSASDRPNVLVDLDGLEHHLAGWGPEQVDLEVSVKDRGGSQQHVTINAWLAGWPHLVATSEDPRIDKALRMARKELVRQIEAERDRQKPHRRPAGSH